MRVLSGDDNNSGNKIDPLSKQESIVKIMVESPKEPPNVEFGVAFPQTTVVRIKTESTHDIEEQQQQQQSDVESVTAISLATDIQEPIDVNIPRDTTNIFYAYEEAEIDNTFHEQQQPTSPSLPPPPPPQQQQQFQQLSLDMPEISQQTIPAHEPDRITMSQGSNSHNTSNNQSVNIEQDNTQTHAPDPSQSDNQSLNSSLISSDNHESNS